MNWLRRKLKNFIFPENEVEASDRQSTKLSRLSIRGGGEFEDRNCLRFHVYNAQGGKIVQVFEYDSKRDENRSSLYVVEANENFGDNIGKIIFMEMLKKG